MECAILNREPSKMTLIFFFTDDFLDKLLYDFLNNFLDAVGLDTLGHFQSCLTEQALVALICFLCEIVNERKGKSNLILQNSLAQLCDVLQRRPCVLKNSVSLHKAKNRYFQHSN